MTVATSTLTKQDEEQRGALVEHVFQSVVGKPVGGAGKQEPPVGVGRPWHRAEPAVGDGERARQRVGERQRILGPVAHRLFGLHGANEPVLMSVARFLRSILRAETIGGGAASLQFPGCHF